ncbi:uncharacterized protein G2W53_041128 [Senna tora]|uniref:Uncharacterized protein n=1 Tax=Senna tora TaxID=362788 RepID=A0A834SEV7_9FABA|nr:uncharacterized protein G2W53_041128 [Senna tora]
MVVKGARLSALARRKLRPAPLEPQEALASMRRSALQGAPLMPFFHTEACALGSWMKRRIRFKKKTPAKEILNKKTQP